MPAGGFLADSVAGVQPIAWTTSNPPTAEDLDGVIEKLNELIGALKRAGTRRCGAAVAIISW